MSLEVAKSGLIPVAPCLWRGSLAADLWHHYPCRLGSQASQALHFAEHKVMNKIDFANPIDAHVLEI